MVIFGWCGVKLALMYVENLIEAILFKSAIHRYRFFSLIFGSGKIESNGSVFM